MHHCCVAARNVLRVQVNVHNFLLPAQQLDHPLSTSRMTQYLILYSDFLCRRSDIELQAVAEARPATQLVHGQCCLSTVGLPAARHKQKWRSTPSEDVVRLLTKVVRFCCALQTSDSGPCTTVGRSLRLLEDEAALCRATTLTQQRIYECDQCRTTP